MGENKMEAERGFSKIKEEVKRECPFPTEDPNNSGFKEWIKSIGVTVSTLDSRSIHLGNLHETSLNFSIYRVPQKLKVPEKLRGENGVTDPYSPHLVSIGPFHRGNVDHPPNHPPMEEDKWWYMLSLLNRTSEPQKSLEECGIAILGLEAKARGTYQGDIQMSRCDLAETLLVDGCFILELLLRSWLNERMEYSDPTLGHSSTVYLQRDLALLENQIPFFILEKLFDTVMKNISKSKPPPYSITDLALSFYFPNYLKFHQDAIKKKWNQGGRHLLDLLHKYFHPTIFRMGPKHKETQSFNKCATELSKDGIKIETARKGRLLDVWFSNGVLRIPRLSIFETTESFFMNLIAFERCSLGCTHHITSYAVLMKSLIQTPADVKLLKQKGIIKIYDDNVKVEDLFKNIVENIKRDQPHDHEVVVKDFYYGKLCEDVNAHKISWWHREREREPFKVRWRRYMEALRRDYFTNPWRIIAFIAAVLLLVLTGIQTFYAVRSYYPK